MSSRKYRLLAPGEVIQSDDEVYSFDDRAGCRLMPSWVGRLAGDDRVTRRQFSAEEASAEALVKFTKEVVEHIEACDEDDLLDCDADKHPPSVFTTLAEQGRDLLDAIAEGRDA